MGELYVLTPRSSPGEGDEWIRPRPIDAAIAEGITTATDLNRTDLADVDDYVDPSEVAALIDDASGAGESVTFTVEGHEVTVDGTGRLSVDAA